ncbi:hypothetical protein [Faucicola boevrei]|uniref:hypothetical protein n=1 Tax=Faucicola boevrei TaxID=346665 RepID=UPI00036A31A7|nr:hypothetical protein [Moraxella boevrei]
MKKVFSGLVLASTFVLTACGGGSSDSSSTYTQSFKKVLTNKNEYSCPTKVAFDACGDDASCKVAKCTLTKEVVKPVDIATTKACTIDGNNVYGKKGESCTFSIAKFNGGATQALTCSTTGAGSIAGGINFGKSFVLNGVTLSCK